MATITTFKRPQMVDLSTRVHKQEILLDFATNPAASGDVIQCFDMPKDSFVLFVGGAVKTAEGGALTADLGDDASATRYISNLDLNAAASFAVEVDSSTISAPYYSATNTIDLKLDGAADAAKVLIFVVYVVLDNSITVA